jgi:hypothetical protein
MRGGSLDLLLVACVIVLAVVLLLLTYRRAQVPALSAQRASWTLTPGVVNPEVTQNTIGVTICSRGWASEIRPDSSYTGELKLQQMRAYSRVGAPTGYQEDHLISLELGGHPTDPRNLWPEPRPRAEDVDRIENDLNAAICSGRLTLADAQRRISDIKHTAG